ncbi:MAG: phenylacetate--CoA ligase family protein, partial [Phycisphaerae bacterium]|nr:phenylacetate--CoA ligase family protein [Phycisphaerae bacterium]
MTELAYKPDPRLQITLRPEAQTPKSKAVLTLLRAMDAVQWWPPARLEQEQFKFLEQLLKHARSTCPYYNQALGSVRSLEAADLQAGTWADVPILPRSTVNAQEKRLLSRSIPKGDGPVSDIYTSGTTGRPIRFFRTRRVLWYWSAFTTRDHLWHNRDFSGKFAAIRESGKGKAPYPKGSRFPAWGSRDSVFKTGPCFGLNINSSIEQMAEWIGRVDPDYLLTHPTVVAALARHCVSEQILFPSLKEIQTISEIVPPGLRETVTEAWGVPLSDMYSGREIGYMALQCPDHAHYHVMSEGVYLEVVDEQGRPCRPGETGRVLVTALQNFVMPLIRYEIGDFAEVGEHCPCGRGLPVLTRILGRQQNMLTLPTGESRWTLLSSGDIRSFMGLAPVRQYQFAQVAKDAIEVRLAVARELTKEEESRIADWTQTKFAYPFDISFKYSDE